MLSVLAAPPLVQACVCFFFQAEDGIRDLTVTGVQTCALPISPARGVAVLRLPARRGSAAHPGADRLRADQHEGRVAGQGREAEISGCGEAARREIGRESCRERV